MTVGNIGFMIDRLGQDCAPLQYLRELTQNSIEAILHTDEQRGEIVWDVDWNRLALDSTYKLAVIDNGTGMTGEDMVNYINALSASINVQSLRGNYGVGAKIAAAPRNQAGLLYLSWKDGVGYMVHLWKDPENGTYGLRQLQRPDGTFGHWGYLEDTVKPKAIDKHGTMVVLLGNEIHQDTMQPPPEVSTRSRWIARYINTRYYSFPPGISVRAREAWDAPKDAPVHSQLRSLTGQGPFLDANSIHRASVPLSQATAHWWILREDPTVQSSTYPVQSTGHVAALYQNELYEMTTGRAGTARLQLFGVIFGYQRVVIYVEPHDETGVSLTSNTARTQLLLSNEPLPWADWAAEFRAQMPDEIEQLMNDVVGASSSADHKQAIKERLRQIRDLLRLTRYRPTTDANEFISLEDATRGGLPADSSNEKRAVGHAHGGDAGGRAGDVYALFLAADGQPARSVDADPDPDVRWVSVVDGTRTAPDLEDRAAKYLPAQNLLLINADFRVFTDMITRWCERYGDAPAAEITIRDVVREWFEQSLIEAVLGVQALRDARYWSVDNIEGALSEEALTTAVLLRYHIDVAVGRALGAKLGSLKDRPVVRVT